MAGQRILTRDLAYQGIRDAVISGEIQPGEQVTEAMLASQFGLSRTPLREAIQRIESEDLMIRQPNGTIIVAPLDVAVMEELFNVKERLEGLLAASAAREKQLALVNQLNSVVHYEAACLESGDWESAKECDERFHALLWEHSSRQIIVRILSGFGALIERFYRLAPWPGQLEDYLRTIHAEHQLMLQAIKEGDTVWAEMAMKSNIRSAKKYLLAAYKSASGKDKPNL